MLRRPLGRRLNADDLPEHADDVAAGVEGHRTELDLDPVAVLSQEDALYIGYLGASDHLLREHLAGVTRLFRGADGRVLPPANVAYDSSAGRIHPADDPVLVDHIRGDVDRLHGAFGAGLKRTQIRHMRILAWKPVSLHRPKWAILRRRFETHDLSLGEVGRQLSSRPR